MCAKITFKLTFSTASPKSPDPSPTKVQESYNTPLEHTPGNPRNAHYERNPFVACW